MTTLSEHRKRAGLSQADVGALLGVRQQTVCNWENGISEPSITQGLTLAKIYKVKPNKLFNKAVVA